MCSSTSSSEPRGAAPPQVTAPTGPDRRTSVGTPLRAGLRWLGRERTVHALGLGLLALLAFAPHGAQRDGLRPECRALLSSRHCADCVLAGDSRIGAALQTNCLGPVLGRVANFGLPRAQYTDSYLNAVENLLAPDSARRVVVLGITPHAFTESLASVGWFERLTSRRRIDVLFGGAIPPPVRIDQLPQVLWPLSPADEPARRSRWLEGITPSAPAARKELAWYRQTFADLRIKPRAVQRLCARVTEWTQRGVRVYALRPPTCAEMLAAEEPAGFDQSAFIVQFEAAGGTWIDVPQTAYETFDSSHLTVGAARQLSERVRAILSADLAGTAHVAQRSVVNGRSQ